MHKKLKIIELSNISLNFKQQPSAEISEPNTMSFDLLDDVSSGNTFRRNVKPLENLYAFVDEKTEHKTNSFVLLGITTNDSGLVSIANMMRKFKKQLIPSLHPDSWYLKADGKYLGANVESDLSEAIARWTLFSQLLDQTRKHFSIHVSYKKNKQKFNEKLIQQNYHQLSSSLIDSVNLLNKANPLTLYIDNIEQPKRLQKLTDSLKFYSHSSSYKNVPKGECDTLVAQALQFVDMLIYVVSRFIFPLKNKLSVLVGFEEYAMCYGFHLLHSKKYEVTQQQVIAHTVLGNLLQQIRYSILHNIYDHQTNKVVGSVRCRENNQSSDKSSQLIASMMNFSNMSLQPNKESLKRIFFEADYLA